MDYQQLWYALKAELLAAADKQEYRFEGEDLKMTVLNKMDALECAAMQVQLPTQMQMQIPIPPSVEEDV